jgi:hypothetical protein
MLSFRTTDNEIYLLKEEDVKAKVTAKITTETIASANSDDKTSGGPDFADRAADQEGAGGKSGT